MEQILTEILALLKVISRDVYEIDQKLTCMVELQPYGSSNSGNSETQADTSVPAGDSERIRIAKHGTIILKGKVT